MADFLSDSRALWDGHARRDPLWAILSDPAKKGGKWDLRRFFQTAVGEISLLFYQLRSRGIVVRPGSALDFGCGVGRLTQALAPHFDRVVGVDVSPAMIDVAHRLNRTPGTVSYVGNQSPDLRLFPDNTFDFIVSNIVLQHIRPDIAVQYVGEFIRVLTPGGVLVFQLPSHERQEADEAPAPAVKAMPDEAYVASLVAPNVPDAVLRPGAPLTLDIEITNQSGFEWSQQEFGVIRVGNHWLDADGAQMLVRDDGRTSLPETVPAGDTCRVPLAITAPPDEGEYVCEIDLAHEGVLWFRDKGSPVLRYAVRVRRHDGDSAGEATGDPASGAVRAASHAVATEAPTLDLPVDRVGDPNADDPGAFPMHGVPTDIVRAVIAEHGGELLHVDNDRSCGDDWVSYRYFVRKAPQGASGASAT